VNETTAILQKLVKQVQTVCRDHFCSSPVLAKTLKDVHKTGWVGTLNVSRRKCSGNYQK
jgi:hypothetical protein